MEKFSDWRDKGTGISPFMPVPSVNRGSFLNKAGHAFAKGLIFIIMFPVVLTASLVFIVTSLKPVLRFILLVCFGLNRIDVSVDGIKRSNTKAIEDLLPKANDVVVANYVSPLDGFLYYLISKESWKNIVILVPDSASNFYVHTPWTLFKNTFAITPSGTKVSKLDLNQYAGKVVVLLLEGTPSNNKALLPFQGGSIVVPISFTIKSLVLKIPGYLTLPIPSVSQLSYFGNLASPLGTKNNLVRAKIYTFPSWDIRGIRNSFEVNGLSSIGEALGIQQKERFFEYWNDYKVKKD